MLRRYLALAVDDDRGGETGNLALKLHAAMDDLAGVERRQRGMIEAVAGESARLEIFDQDVGLGGESADLTLPLGALQIDRE